MDRGVCGSWGRSDPSTRCSGTIVSHRASGHLRRCDTGFSNDSGTIRDAGRPGTAATTAPHLTPPQPRPRRPAGTAGGPPRPPSRSGSRPSDAHRSAPGRMGGPFDRPDGPGVPDPFAFPVDYPRSGAFSPARTTVSSQFSSGGSGHANVSLYAQNGLYARLKSRTTSSPSSSSSSGSSSMYRPW